MIWSVPRVVGVVAAGYALAAALTYLGIILNEWDGTPA